MNDNRLMNEEARQMYKQLFQATTEVFLPVVNHRVVNLKQKQSQCFNVFTTAWNNEPMPLSRGCRHRFHTDCLVAKLPKITENGSLTPNFKVRNKVAKNKHGSFQSYNLPKKSRGYQKENHNVNAHQHMLLSSLVPRHLGHSPAISGTLFFQKFILISQHELSPRSYYIE
ncbi:hypothetical protein K501DRAFT_276065 [Backusella circina FSU 941]|nr:hypothetical protein K501DRAFT_276065 [Backusella circina FSU 941]